MMNNDRERGGTVSQGASFVGCRTARIGPGVLVPGFLRDFGVDTDRFFQSVGIDPSVLESSDNTIPYAKNAELYAAAARATGRDNFGVMVGISAGLHHLGLLGIEMRKCKTVYLAWKMCSEALPLQVRGASIEIVREGDTSLIRYIICDPTVTSGAQISSGAIAWATSVMRELCGPGWRAKSVELPLRVVRNTIPFHAAFGCPVRFNRPYAVLRIDSDWLTRTPYNLVSGSPTVLPRMAGSVSEAVREICVRRLVSGAHIDSAAIARALGMSRRTLYRRLGDENVKYQALIQSERMSLARRLIFDTEISITDIGFIAGYSEASAFSRAFHNWFGYSPREARSACRLDEAAAVLTPC